MPLIFSLAASSALSLLYGQRLQSEFAHRTVDNINAFTHTVTMAAAPATLPWIDVFPILDRLPNWMVPEKRRGLLLKRQFTDLHEDTLNSVRRKVVSAHAMMCSRACG